MELALIIFGVLGLIIFLYKVRKNKKQDNKDSYVGFIILLVAGGALLKACDIV